MFKINLIEFQFLDSYTPHIYKNAMITTLAQMAPLCPLGPFLAIVRFVEYRYGLFALFALAAAFVSKGIYNVCFHDLHHVPGPFLGGFTDFYKVYIFGCRHIPSATMELHRHYGLLSISLCTQEYC